VLLLLAATRGGSDAGTGVPDISSSVKKKFPVKFTLAAAAYWWRPRTRRT